MPAENFLRSTGAPREFIVGGEIVYVQKMTPRAEGIIQGFLVTHLQNPHEAARDAIAGMPEDEARNYWCAAAFEAQKTWPPSVGSELGMTLLGTPEGRGTLIWAAAQKHTRDLTRAKAAELGEAMTADEFFALLAIIGNGEIGDIKNPGHKGDGTPYPVLRARLCEKHPGWTYDTVDDMTFEQIGMACNEGKPVEVPMEDDEQLEAVTANWRDYYVGL